MQAVTIYQALILALVVGSIIYTSVVLTNVSTDSDSMLDLKNHIYIISGVNSAIIIILGILSFLYVRTDPLQERSYVLIMLHVNLFISLLAVSISSLQQLA
jgi:hypothetical protein